MADHDSSPFDLLFRLTRQVQGPTRRRSYMYTVRRSGLVSQCQYSLRSIFQMPDACFVLSVGKTCIIFCSQVVCQPAIFRLLAVMHMLGCSVPPGTSVTAKHMLASCSIYYYHSLGLDIASDSEMGSHVYDTTSSYTGLWYLQAHISVSFA